MLTVHHLGVSQSERIVWLCEELGLAYQLKRYDREPMGMAPADYKALHPLGAAPVITDGEVVLAESGAIIDYILGKYGDGRLAVGPDRANFADYLYWLHFANGTFVPAQMVLMFQRFMGAGDGAGPADFLKARGERLWRLVEARLATAPYFAGPDFTAADIIMGFPLTTMRTFLPHDLAPYPALRAYLQRIGDRPTYRSAMQKADPQMTPMLG